MQAKHQRRRAPKHRRLFSPGMLQNGGIRVLLSCIVVVLVAGALTLPGISASKQDLENAGVALSASVASEQEEGSQEDAPDAASTDKSAGEKAADKADSDPEPSSTPTKDAANAENTEDAAENPDADTDSSDEDADAMPAQSFSGELKNKKDEVVLSVEVESPEGALPAGTTMELEAVKAKDVKDAVGDAVAEKTDAKVDSLQAVDITFKDADGNEVEPAADVAVKMASPQITDETNPYVVNVDDKGEGSVVDQLTDKQLEQRDQQLEDNELAFDAAESSVYAIAYTVDFRWEVNGKTYEFSIPGGGFTSLGQMTQALGLANADADEADDGAEAAADDAADGETTGDEPKAEVAASQDEAAIDDEVKAFVADVKSVEFSDPSLVWVGKTDADTTVASLKEANELDVQFSSELTKEQIETIESKSVEAGDWALISLRPFMSAEKLTVTMNDGEVFTIEVTDAQISAQYLSDNGDLYEVTVAYGEDAQIPEGASLRVTPYAEDSEEYAAVRDVVLGDAGDGAGDGDADADAADAEVGDAATGEAAAEATAEAEADVESDDDVDSNANIVVSDEIGADAEDDADSEADANAEAEVEAEGDVDAGDDADASGDPEAEPAKHLEALDISIVDASGEPIEPKAAVRVTLGMKSLSGQMENVQDSLTVTHLDASTGEVHAETVADTDELNNIHLSGETPTASFMLESFSQFAITYYGYEYEDWELHRKNYVTVNVHYVDVNGNELNGTHSSDVNTQNEQMLNLGDYADEIQGHTYLGAHYGTYSGQAVTSLTTMNGRDGDSIDKNSGRSVVFRNGDNIVARQEYDSSTRVVDVYLVYAPSTGYYIADTIGENGCLVVCDQSGEIQTGANQNLFVRWYRSGSASGDFEEVTRSKVLDGNYNIPELGCPRVNVSIDEGADKYYKAEVYRVENNEPKVVATTPVYHVPYYDDVQNGGFETPHNNGTVDESVHRWQSNWQVTNGQNDVVWKTTGTASDHSGRDIEIPQGANANGQGANNVAETLRNYCFAFMPEGNQCAELNCEAAGALYQDVLTIPGSQMYWSLYHRARGGYDAWKNERYKTQNRETDTMYVVAMSKDLAEKYDVTTQEKVLYILNHVNDTGSEFHDIEIVKITTTNQGNGVMTFMNSGASVTVPATWFGSFSEGQTATVTDGGNNNRQYTYGNTDWHYYTGNFSIPQNQYLTRFFFVAGAKTEIASGNNTMGNFLDDIHLSDSVPAPNYGQATVIIQKTVKGLGELPSDYATRIETKYKVTHPDTTVNVVDRNSDYDSYQTQIDPATGTAVSTARWTFPISFGGDNVGSTVQFERGVETNPVAEGKTDVVGGYTQTTSWVLHKQSANQSEPVEVASGSGKTIPTTDMEKLDVKERDIVYIEFINNYTPKKKVSIWKTDTDGKVITTGASFALYKASDFNDSTQQPNSGAEAIVTGKTGSNGILSLGELADGEYRLVETSAPAGYNALSTAVKIVISNGNVTATQGGNNADIAVKGDSAWVEGQPDDTVQVQVWNTPGVELPNTGGPGTMSLYVLGALMVTCAAAFLLRRRTA